MSSNTSQGYKRKLDGTVINTNNDKTIVVSVQRRFKDRRYSKFVYKTKKYHAHDENSEAKKGDWVQIVESRPHSKLKTWELMNIKQPATQV